MAEPNPEAQHNPALTREWRGEEDTPDQAYDPSDLEATRGRQQGLGVGARDLERQQDPDRDLASDIPEMTGEAGADPDDTGS